jgi:hypothetical protein
MADDGIEMDGEVAVRLYEAEDTVSHFMRGHCAPLDYFLRNGSVAVAERDGRICGLIVVTGRDKGKYTDILAADNGDRGVMSKLTGFMREVD